AAAMLGLAFRHLRLRVAPVKKEGAAAARARSRVFGGQTYPHPFVYCPRQSYSPSAPSAAAASARAASTEKLKPGDAVTTSSRPPRTSSRNRWVRTHRTRG